MLKDPIFCEPGFHSSPFGPPPHPGVYAICVMSEEAIYNKRKANDHVIYIGASKNIAKRVLNPAHIYRRTFGLVKHFWVYTLALPCENYIDLERRLIRKYKPRFNKQIYG